MKITAEMLSFFGTGDKNGNNVSKNDVKLFKLTVFLANCMKILN